MKIAIFRTDPQVQDLNTYNSQELGLAGGLKGLGHTVDVYLTTRLTEGKLSDIEVVEPGIRIIRVNYFLLPILAEPIYRGVKERFRNERYDLVQINEEGNVSTFLLSRICTSLGVRFVIYQGMYRVLSGRKWKYYEWIHHRIFRPYIIARASAIFCKTGRAKIFLEDRGYSNTHIIPVGLDFSRFEDRVDCDWRKRLNIGVDKQIILYVGALESRRNPDFMISLAKACGTSKAFIIIGSGSGKQNIELASKEQSNGLNYLGALSQKELPSLYEQSDVFILPSNYEIYGMVVIESLYFGTPVVSTRTAGPEDILATDNLGLIQDSLEVDDWLMAIDFYGRKDEDSSDVRGRVRYATSRFDWKNIASRYMEKIK